MTQIKDLNSIAYDGAYFVPIQKADGTTGKILISAIGGSLSAWQLKTSSYTAVAGDRLRIDATARDVVISLPASPTATDSDIWLQRLDTSANKVLIRSGSNKLNAQTAKDGVFAPTVIQAIERLSYVDANIGWLGQYDRLTYQAAPSGGLSPYRSSLILNCKFDGVNGSTTFIDDYGATIARATTGNTAISTAQAKFGTGSLYVDGTPLGISNSVGKDKYNFPGQYTVQAWVYISAGTVFDTNSSHLLSRCDNASGRPTEYAFSIPSATSMRMAYGTRGSSEVQYSATIPALSVGWNHIAFTRDVGNVMRFFANGVLGTGANATPTDATALGNSANNVYIGGFFPPYGLAQGLYIDSLEIDDVCLYNAVFTPPTAPTAAP